MTSHTHSSMPTTPAARSQISLEIFCCSLSNQLEWKSLLDFTAFVCNIQRESNFINQPSVAAQVYKMTDGPTFERNLGSDGSHGINFEWETTLLTYLRCEKLHQDWKQNNDTGVKSFFVANNVKGVGAFDDVVARVEYVEQGEVKTKLLLCQCKHVTDATKIDKFQNYLGPKEIQKYFDSFLKVYQIFAEDYKQSTKHDDPKKQAEEIKLKALFDCSFEECELLFLSNIASIPSNVTSINRIQYDDKQSGVTTHLFPDAIGNEYGLNTEWCLKNLKCNSISKENLVSEFCKRLRVFLNQDDKMHIHINSAIKNCGGNDIDDTDTLRSTMLGETKLIFDTNSKLCTAMTEKTDLLEKTLGFIHLKKSSEENLKRCRQKLQLSSKDAIKEISEKESGSWINITSNCPKIEKLRIFRTFLDLCHGNVCLILKDEKDVDNLILARQSQSYMQAERVYIFVDSNIEWNQEQKHNEIFVKINKDQTKMIKEISDETELAIENSIVTLQGYETKIGTICSNWKDILDEQTICKILESERFVIGRNLPAYPDCYIERKFKMKVVTDEMMMKFKSLISDECKDKILLFSKELSNGSEFKCNTFQTIQDLRTYIGKQLDSKYRFYCFSYFKDKLEFRFTFGTQSKSLDEKIENEEYLTNVECGQRILVLNDVAGMGKSTTMLALAIKYKEINKARFVYFIELNKHGNTLDNDCINAEALKFLATKLLKLKRIEYDMFINACIVTGNVAIFFDAYDELSESGQENISSLIAELESTTKIGRIFISSRPKCANNLEKIFLLKSFEFLELLSEEMESCLFKYWKKMMKCEVENEQKLRQIVHKIIGTLETKLNILNELLATPLQIKMISKAYFKSMLIVCKNEEENNFIEINVINLYDKFVHSYAEHYFEVKLGGNWINWDKQKKDREIQEKLRGAFEFGCSIVVPGLKIQIQNELHVLQTLHNDLGLLISIDPPLFIHRTVAEFLAAKYIVTHLFVEQNDQHTTHMIEILLIDESFDVLRKFINLILQSDHYPKYFDDIEKRFNIVGQMITYNTALHSAASEGNTNLLKALLQRDNTLINIRNCNGRTAFHLACLSGKMETAKILMSMKECSVDTVDKFGNTPLHDAIQKNNSIVELKSILNYEVQNPTLLQTVCTEQCKKLCKLLNRPNNYGYTSMHLAVELNNAEIVKLLLDVGTFNMSLVDKNGNNILHYAATTGSVEIMQLLLDYNETQIAMKNEGTPLHLADSVPKIDANKILLNQKNEYGANALHRACYCGNIEAVNFLKHRCSLNEKDNSGDTVLHVATNRNYITIMTLLLHCDPTLVHQRNCFKKSPLHMACYFGFTEAVEILLKYNVSVNEPDQFGNTAFHMAANGSHVDILQKLLQKDSSLINQKNDFGETALLYAIACGSSNAVDMLIATKCSINERDMNGNTPFHVAAKENRVQIMNQILLKCDPSLINEKNNDGNTALHLACMYGANDAVKFLIKHCSVNERDRNGDSLLHLAAEKNHVKIMECLLISNIFLINLQNNNGETALHVACEKGHTDAVKLLLANGCAVDLTDKGKKTALHPASKWGRRAIVILLLENNCSAIIDLKDGESKTALQYAKRSGFIEIVKILQENGATDVNPTRKCIIS